MRIETRTAALLFVLVVMASFAIPTTLAAAKTVAKTEGGGKIISVVPGNVSTFGFIAENNSGIVRGKIQYKDHGAKIKLHGNVTTLVVDKVNGAAVFGGKAVVTNSTGAKKELSYEVHVKAGKKGVGTFRITLPSGYSEGSTLLGGDIKVDP